MSAIALRELLQNQIATAPDELLPEISDFIAFVTTRRQGITYVDWSAEEWRDFTLANSCAIPMMMLNIRSQSPAHQE